MMAFSRPRIGEEVWGGIDIEGLQVSEIEVSAFEMPMRQDAALQVSMAQRDALHVHDSTADFVPCGGIIASAGQAALRARQGQPFKR
jgi:hypothetical protein